MLLHKIHMPLVPHRSTAQIVSRHTNVHRYISSGCGLQTIQSTHHLANLITNQSVIIQSNCQPIHHLFSEASTKLLAFSIHCPVNRTGNNPFFRQNITCEACCEICPNIHAPNKHMNTKRHITLTHST